MSAQEHEPIGTVASRTHSWLAVRVCHGCLPGMFPEHDQVMVLPRAGDSESLGVMTGRSCGAQRRLSRAGHIRRAPGEELYRP